MKKKSKIKKPKKERPKRKRVKKERPKKKKVKRKRPKKETILLNPRKIRIKVVGIGGGAGSIVSEMASSLKGISFMVFDTDQRSFKKLSPKIKGFQFGQEITRGWGTGMNPEIAEKAALTVKEKIKKNVEDVDLLIVISCLGGGVSSGSSIVFSQVLKEEKSLCLGIFTLPFSFEGEKKMRLAKNSLKRLKENLSGTIVLPNEEILKRSEKKASLKKSLSLMNQILIDYLQDLIEMVSLPGIINIDFADLKTILKGRGQTICFGRGIGQGVNRVEEAIKKVFENPFFLCPLKIKKILFNISNGKDLGLKEVEEAAQTIFKLNPRSKIIFGISQNQKLAKKVKITFLGIGEDFKEKEEKKPIKKKKKKKAEPKKKKKIRRSALEVKKAEKEEEEKEWFGEEEWEIPAFLRKKMK